MKTKNYIHSIILYVLIFQTICIISNYNITNDWRADNNSSNKNELLNNNFPYRQNLPPNVHSVQKEDLKKQGLISSKQLTSKSANGNEIGYFYTFNGSGRVENAGQLNKLVPEVSKNPFKINTVSTTSFISRWDTTKTSFGSSGSNQVTLPLESRGDYNFMIDWGDGAVNAITSYNQQEVRHTYSSNGIYTLNITGTIIGWNFNEGGDRLKIIEISQWGTFNPGNSGYNFAGCSNLVLTATDAPDLWAVETLSGFFAGCVSLGSNGSMDNWDTIYVQDMSSMFAGATSFNQSINNWYMLAPFDMSSMFAGASSFNQPLDNWDVSGVMFMDGMFVSATSFNQPLSTWDVSHVYSMDSMFALATSFNQPLGTWDVSFVTDMAGMFSGVTLSTRNYNQLLTGWAKLPLQQNVFFTGGFSKYYGESVAKARLSIINNFGWTITDGGPDTTSFVSRWDTTQWSVGSSNTNQIKLPLIYEGKYNFTVDWGDGKIDRITSNLQPEVLHTYSSSGIYTLFISGKIEGIMFDNQGDKEKIIEISQWGSLKLVESFASLFYGYYFAGCFNLVLTATDAPDLTGIKSLHSAFDNCISLGDSGSMDNWDVSGITDMQRMFYGANMFNKSIGDWDVSSVTDMSYMFDSTIFNNPIANWNVGNVKNMAHMFEFSLFNQPIDDWDVSQVTDMSSMFYVASFNQSLANWDVSKVTDMSSMFFEAYSFNQPLGTWNVSKVKKMAQMFTYATLSYTNYDQLLVGWSTLQLQQNVVFDGGNSQYTLNAKDARDYIETIFCWTITDKGLLTVPSAPQFLEATVVESYIYVNWTAPVSDGGTPITGYIIYRSTSGTDYSIIDTVSKTKLSYNDTIVNKGQIYYYIIKAENKMGESEESNEVTITIPAIIPSAPQFLKAIAETDQVRLNWTSPNSDGGSLITGYAIYRSGISGSDYSLIVTVSSETFTYNDTSVINGQTYYYIIKAINCIGQSEASNEIKITVPATIPSAPQQLEATIGEDDVTLTWNVPNTDGGSPIAGYTIYRSITSASGYSIITTVSNTTFTYSDNTIGHGETYYYIVKAENSIGESQSSNEVKVVISNVSTTATTSTSVSTTSTTSTTNSSHTSSKSSGFSSGFQLIIFLVIIMPLAILRHNKNKRRRNK